jgi:TonB family protein
MTAHFDPLSERERLGRPFVGSVLMHALLFSSTVAYSWIAARSRIAFGNPDAMPGGTVPINIVKNIPLAPAQTVIANPVANDSRFSVPTPPEKSKAQAKSEEPDPDAIALPDSKANKARREPRVPERKFRPYVPERDNQLYAMKGMGVNTPSFSGLQPNGFGVGIGFGAGSPFGSRHGWYVEALQRRIGEAWQRELMQVDARVRTAPRTVVFFEILRDGSLRSIRVAQSSGNSSVDYAALRAVTNSNPVPALPSDVGKSLVSTEVSFLLKR